MKSSERSVPYGHDSTSCRTQLRRGLYWQFGTPLGWEIKVFGDLETLKRYLSTVVSSSSFYSRDEDRRWMGVDGRDAEE